MGFGVWGLGFGGWGSGFGVWDLVCGVWCVVWGLVFGVWCLGFEIWGLGSRVQGFGIGVWVLGFWDETAPADTEVVGWEPRAWWCLFEGLGFRFQLRVFEFDFLGFGFWISV